MVANGKRCFPPNRLGLQSRVYRPMEPSPKKNLVHFLYTRNTDCSNEYADFQLSFTKLSEYHLLERLVTGHCKERFLTPDRNVALLSESATFTSIYVLIRGLMFIYAISSVIILGVARHSHRHRHHSFIHSFIHSRVFKIHSCIRVRRLN